MVEVRDQGVQAQEVLSVLPSSEPKLTALVSSGGPVFLGGHGDAPRRGDDMLVVNVTQARDLPDGRPRAAGPICVK